MTTYEAMWTAKTAGTFPIPHEKEQKDIKLIQTTAMLFFPESETSINLYTHIFTPNNKITPL